MLKSVIAALSFMTVMLFGCNSPQTVNQSSVAVNQPSNASQESKTTRLHIDGFMKSKSGAT